MTFRARETSDAIVASGPVCTIGIGWPHKLVRAFKHHGLQAPPPVSARMLIDTGAVRCVVKPWVFAALKLPPYDVAHINTATTTAPVEVPAHVADLCFDGTTILRNMRVLASELHGQAIDGLLGRDALAHGVLEYRGIHKSWSLEVHAPPFEE